MIRSFRDEETKRVFELRGDRAGQHSIRINDQWRISFVWRGSDSFDVEIADDH